MPPKKELTHDIILNKSLELTRESGFESITARSLAKELGCSTQPIYQEFRDMSGLKAETAKLTMQKLSQYIKNDFKSDMPKDLSIILSYIHFALKEKKLFQLIIQSGLLFSLYSSEKHKNDTMPDDKMIIFANGIIMMTAFNTLDDSYERAKALTIEAYNAFNREKPYVQ